MLPKILKGNSGCRVELLESSIFGYKVRKTSPNSTYDERLSNQIEKQRYFGELGFKVPEIIDNGVNQEGQVFFDMQYIPGITLERKLNTTISNFEVKSILAVLEQLLVLPEVVPEPEKIHQKITQLKATLNENGLAQKCLAFLSSHDWTTVKWSECHGDLTLENMIISERGIYLLDFQDVSPNSFVQDLGKLYFDLDFGWSSRYQTTQNSLNINKMNRIFLKKSIDEHFIAIKSAPHREEIVIVEMLNSLRVLPYVRDSKSREVTQNALKDLATRLEIS